MMYRKISLKKTQRKEKKNGKDGNRHDDKDKP
jgi:hypothetical protein